MKYILIYQCLLIFSCVSSLTLYSQVSITKERGYLIEFNEKELNGYKKISEFDTMTNFKKVKAEIWTDSLLLKTAKFYFQYENNTIVFERVEVYYKELLIFSSINDKGIPLEKYSYVYDSKGRIIRRSGFGSGNSGSTTYTTYQNE